MSYKTKKSNPWSATDEEILLQKIRDTPNNLSYAFEQARGELSVKRGVRSISSHWYNVLRSDPKTGAIFGMISSRGAIANTKNMRRPEPRGEQWTMSVATMAVSKLNKAQRIEIIEKIMQMK